MRLINISNFDTYNKNKQYKTKQKVLIQFKALLINEIKQQHVKWLEQKKQQQTIETIVAMALEYYKDFYLHFTLDCNLKHLR